MAGLATLKGALVATIILCGLPAATAHTWVEQLNRIAPNGTMIDPAGYQRAFIGRGDPGFKGDISDDLWQIPPNGRAQGAVILDSDKICSPQQTIGAYANSEYPQLVTAPGDYVALRHEENGHVTLPTTQKNKPRNRGTIYIYGTEEPRADDTLMSIHNVWNTAGTGGDKRGRLLATRNYDDGQCYQYNSGEISTSRQKQFSKVNENPQGADLWCQSDLQLPTDITVGSDYTLYWVWDWPTLSKDNAMIGDEGVTVTTPEVYTSCMDLKIVDACSDDLGDVKSPACGSNKAKTKMAKSFVKDQSYSNAAIPEELSGNFAVAVDGANADSSSNDGMSAPPNLVGSAATGGAGRASAAASTFQTVTTPASAANKGAATVTQLSTVTVTQGVSTVTVTAGATSADAAVALTASATMDAATAPSNAPVVVGEDSTGGLVIPTPGVAPSVEPITFKKKRSRIERTLH
ncbi:hypothetical protein VMCG_08388 [Cytospora schulzeri]|uniref:DUF7492 domain-containing protein n=1 Tax=Cytospora schulzeri TaxID=448051 RepID=A0A423VQY2_9PEZI|nr:hypothetical protein VMCG_08388 [Valsa malicola]